MYVLRQESLPAGIMYCLTSVGIDSSFAIFENCIEKYYLRVYMMEEKMESHIIKKNTVYNIIKTVSAILFPLVTFPYVSRVLQPDNIGRINFGNSIVTYISLLATLGVTTYAVRECSQNKDDREKLGKLSGEILSINLFTTFIAYAVLAVLLLFYAKLYDYRLLIAIQSLSVIFATLGADWLNTAMEDFKYITVRTVAFQIVSIVLMLLFVRKPDDYFKYAIITVFSSSGANVVNIFYRKRFCNTKLTINANIKKHLPPILSLFAMMMAQQVFTMCDTTIIGLTLGDYQVGLYSTAVKIYNIINQVIASITWVVMPQLSIYFAKNNIDGLKKVLKYALQFSSVIGIPCVIGMFMLSSEIITAAGGESYAGASMVLKILSLTLLAGLASNFTFNMNLLAAGRDKLCLIICVISAVLNIVTNLIFIPLYGINAAAVTTCISQIVITMISIPFLEKRLFSIDLIRIIVQPLAASVGLLIIVFAVRFLCNNIWLKLIFSTTLGAILYFGILVFLKNEMITEFFDSLICRIKKQ